MAAAAFTFEETERMLESTLETHDIERELKRMKKSLALLDLRRQLLGPEITGRTALQIADAMLAIQNDA